MMLIINQGAAVLTQLDDRSQSPIVKVVTPRGINFNLRKQHVRKILIGKRGKCSIHTGGEKNMFVTNKENESYAPFIIFIVTTKGIFHLI